MLTGKVALITGASRGIGAAIAEKYAALGADLALIYAENAAAAERLCAALSEAHGVKALAYRCNVADFSEAAATVSAVKAEFQKIDILVNNAGITRDGLVSMMREADFDAVVDVNLKGAFHMIRHCTPVFLRNKGGKIINISSVAGLMGNPGQANYSAAKAGLLGLTKSVARELAAKNITCNAIAPGFIETDMTKSLDENNALAARIPLKRMGKASEVAELAAFLALSGYITGETIRIDGGLAM